MKMLVCVKQVPDTAEIRIDPVKNTLIRDGVPSIVNPYDAYALEMAARIKDASPGSEIVLLSMGPEQAKSALKECLSVGGDRAILLSDRAFGGSDASATSYILATAIKKLEAEEGAFDLIFCGKQSIDGDTAQVGPKIAEHLGIPQITYAIDTMVDGDLVKVRREVDEGFELIAAKMPCLVTVTKPFYEPRFPTIRSKMTANRKEITVYTCADFDGIDTAAIGLTGSPTKVKDTFTPPVKSGCVMIHEETGADSAMKLFGALVEADAL
ncbi:MAG: electron transfer flavoprotein subunit beta/FixA family protein [Oscillospiraceae bacterium]|jgi:electron transfer flavoprotein beta subunit|nr:electron transfer flavoprotein subunit beta/FixA family protein [Oscillospiraceae bacterium]